MSDAFWTVPVLLTVTLLIWEKIELVDRRAILSIVSTTLAICAAIAILKALWVGASIPMGPGYVSPYN